MATQSAEVTEAPAAVNGLEDGATYSGQIIGSGTVYMLATADAPHPATPAYVWRPLERLTWRKDAGETLWVWTERGASSRVVYDKIG